MGQVYHLSGDRDELLSEAEAAFDLSARLQSTNLVTSERRDDVETHDAPGFFHRLFHMAPSRSLDS